MLLLSAAACTEDEDGGAAQAEGTDAPVSDGTGAPGAQPTGEPIDYEAVGLWDDGPCDESLEPLILGLTTVFESPVLSLVDQALALEASAEAFNQRGGANGSCIEIHACDDGGDPNQAISCVRELDEAGVVATVNDQTTTAQAEVSAAMAEAGIPRIASNVSTTDQGDQNAYPLDASGSGSTFLMPAALAAEGVEEVGVIRVDFAEAAVLPDIFGGIYGDDGITFPFDAPVPSGTTDYSQFILGAESEGVGGIVLALGEQEAVQIVRAAQQLDSELIVGGTLGTFSYASLVDLGDFAEQMVFVSSYPPATVDLPIYEVLRDDLAASGEESLQAENLKGSPMRSWIGLYATLRMIRDAGMTEFTRDGISQMLQSATDVPMLDMFQEGWTPDVDHAGLFQRSGISSWATYRWDPEAPAPAGLDSGNFVEVVQLDFDEVLCGSPLGGPC